MKTTDHTPWVPGAFVSIKGIVIKVQYVATLLSREEVRAAREATAAIYRMMQR